MTLFWLSLIANTVALVVAIVAAVIRPVRTTDCSQASRSVLFWRLCIKLSLRRVTHSRCFSEVYYSLWWFAGSH